MAPISHRCGTCGLADDQILESLVMESEPNKDLIDQFINVTGVDRARAKFYLESAAGNLQVALGSFYEEGDYEPEVIPPLDVDSKPAVQSKSVATSDWTTALASASSGQVEPDNPPALIKQPSRFATLSGMEDNSSDEDEGQAFYAGGSERSGQQILGPGKKPKDDIVANMFKAAKEHGAEIVDPASPEAQSKMTPFKGTGFRLGANETDSEVVASGSQSQGFGAKVKTVVLKMWKNGFSMDDGPLREYTDPANRTFLDSISRGEIPSELLREARGIEVNLNMEDHRQEDYEPVKQPIKAFTGKGQMLGSPVPTIASVSSAIPQDQKQCEQEATRALNVDAGQPVTNVQIRLADGSRIVARLNHTHTVGDLRRFITIARPQYASSLFSLLTSFPSGELNEDQISIKDAKLLNAVVMQRLQ